MGMLYRRKKKDPTTGNLVERGPWWMKYYDHGRPVYRSTEKHEKREALKALHKAEGKVADGQRERFHRHRPSPRPGSTRPGRYPMITRPIRT